jgi:2-polyprenyl-3-methyl-5-hydroxy-6-metoxy-1,4-benzoquinol methylase
VPASFLASGKNLGNRHGSSTLPFLVDLRERCVLRELMDQPDLDERDHKLALRGLSRINAWSRSDAILWPSLRALCQAESGKAIRVLDMASGAGDVPVRLWRRARRAGLPLHFSGCDRSRAAVRAAAVRAAEAGADVHFFTLDALADPIPGDFDVLTCSLFLHHLERPDAVRFLARTAAAARRMLLVNDLERSAMGYALAWFGTRLLTRSPIVHTDGPLSVRAAFTREEVRTLANEAGLQGASIRRKWPFRYLLEWSRD